jgi:hypothetical protein
MALPTTPEKLVALETRELALLILARLKGAAVVNRKNFIAETIGTMPPPVGRFVSPYARTMNSEPAAAQALAEAWDWLFLNGLVSPDPVAQHDNYFVTRRGQRVLADVAVLEEEW